MSSKMKHGRPDAARALMHPVWWIALGVLLLNDHVLKGAGLLPGSLTGKLSDVAGLIVAPVVLAFVLAVSTRRAMWLVIAAVGSWFSLINTVPAMTRGWEQLTQLAGIPWKLWCDPSDLLALPALGVSVWLLTSVAPMRQPNRRQSRRIVAERLLAMLGAVSCMATSVGTSAVPASTPGKVFSRGAAGGLFYVIDSATGRRLAAPEFEHSPAATVEVDGVVYGVLGSEVVGYSIDGGREAMRFELDEGSFHRVALTDGERIFMLASPASGSVRERVVAVDLATGKLLWEALLPGREASRAWNKRPMMAGGLIVVPVENRLVAFDPGTGRHRWQHEAKSGVNWPTAEGGSVFVVDEEGTIEAIDLQRGNVLWRHAVGSYDGFDSGRGAGPPFGAGSSVVAFVRGGKLTAIEFDTRALRWQGPKVSDVVVGEDIVVGRMDIDGDEHLVGFRMSDGQRLWKLNADDWSNATPVIDDDNGLVLIRTSPDELRAYTTRGGRLQWRFMLDDGQRADILHGRVWLSNARNL